MSLSDEYLTKRVKIARIWAELDGCEGGDLLNTMCDLIEMAHYSNALAELAIRNELLDLIELEIGAMESMAQDPDEFGFDEDMIAETLDRIKKIEDED